MPAASNLIDRFTRLIIDPAILVIFAAGFFLFMYGLVTFMMSLESAEGRKTGVKHMMYGMIGMLVMVSVYGIIALMNNTFDLGIGNPDINRINNVGAPTNFFQ